MAEAKPIKYPNALENSLIIKCVRVTSKSTILMCIQDIKKKFKQDEKKPSKLKHQQYKKFLKSCFGTLLEMPNIALSGGILHNLIIRQAESMSSNVVEFNFNGKGAIFTEKEFGIITGLNMDSSFDAPPPPRSNRIRNKYFDAYKVIKNAELTKVFNSLRRRDLEEEDDLVKLCLLYFLECGILGKESQTKINEEHFSMVEDLEYFNRYPWGLESYNATILSIHKVMALHKGELNPSCTYSLCGFPLAFQVITISILFNFLFNI